VDFKIIETPKTYKLDIIEPGQNEAFEFERNGSILEVIVENIGDGVLEGVCVYLEDLNLRSSCKNISVGEEESFNLTVIPPIESQKVILFANNSNGHATDEIEITIEGVGMEETEELNVTEENVTGVSNESAEGGKITIKEKEPEGGGYFLGMSLEWIIIIVVIPLIILAVYVRMSLSAAKKAEKKGEEEAT
jgi:hypothetical protein